ncbi:Holliday junction resolvase RecU [Jeotgalicoccus marinus]|uniref:Holliday junction resolvase RecU n=1 Tax=Jeotgalicoccus marinus TaxID=516700 RepID=UPI00047BFE03|nr:Holliday junction resolvase RecU [Jeotgalicoccus marinus]
MQRTYANRGKFLEDVIDRTNIVYKNKNIALVDKVATPINYNTRTGKAFYKQKSTVDYIGCINNGPFIAFDAKQTAKKSFPFNNVSEHQKNYLQKVHELGHLAFLIIYFTDYKECYRLTIDKYLEYERTVDRKSIPYEWMTKHATLIKTGAGTPLDYLKEV